MSDLFDPTRIPTPLARQAAAADFWMQLTGRKAEAARALDEEAAEKSAEAYTQQEIDARMRAPSTYARRGLIAGAALGAGVAGLAAHRFNAQEAARVGELAGRVFKHPVTEVAPAVSVGKAVLGGGLAGGGAGGLTGGVLGVRRALAPAEEQRKQASAYEQLVEYLAARPALRAAAGATAAGVPLGALGYHLEKGKHTPGPGGVSPHNVGTNMDLARHDAEAAAGAHSGVVGKARRLWLEKKDQAAADASRSPRRSAAIGSIAYALPGALAGAGLASRVLK